MWLLWNLRSGGSYACENQIVVNIPMPLPSSLLGNIMGCATPIQKLGQGPIRFPAGETTTNTATLEVLQTL